MAESSVARSASIPPAGSPLALALAVVQMLNEQFETEVSSADILSSGRVKLGVRLRPRVGVAGSVIGKPNQPDDVVLRFSPVEIDATTLLSHCMRELKNAAFVMVELDGVGLRLSQDG
jgi:hypothetical protein